MVTKADDTNLQKIKSFNAKASAAGGQIPVPSSTATPVTMPTSRMSVGDIQLLLADPQTLSKEELLRRQALSTKENLRIAEEEHKKQQAKDREEALKRRDAQQLIKGEALNLGGNVADRAAPVGNWMAAKPHPGGIAGILILIAVFLLAIVPTAPTGKTRLHLIWLTLTGKTHIDYSKTGTGTSQQQQSTTTTTTTLAASTPAVIPNTQTTPTVQPTAGVNITDAIAQAFGLPPTNYTP